MARAGLGSTASASACGLTRARPLAFRPSPGGAASGSPTRTATCRASSLRLAASWAGRKSSSSPSARVSSARLPTNWASTSP
eukprot:9718621-Alexandrium_andersonii.AAC.1